MWEIRTITDEEVDLYRARIDLGFGQDPSGDEDARRRFTDVFENDRMFAAFDGGDIIGTGGALSFGLTVPGGATVPMGGTTVVTVQPTHRRQGVLRALMQAHLDEVADRGEPIAGLWASESSIYGRFGFGPATYRQRVTMGTRGISMRSTEPTGQVRLLDVEEAKPLVREVYEQIRPKVAGMLTRSDGWWHARHLHEREGGGSSKRRFAVCFNGESVGGYVAYRQKGKWEDFIAQGEIEVSELMAITPEAHRALWSYLINIDLFTELEWWNVAVDDPLPEIVTDPRRVVRTLVDGMWLRLLDIPAALMAREYESDGAIVLRVEDFTRPANSGTYRLEVVEGAADCSATSDEPHVTCDVDVLGHLYLGGGNAFAMAAANRLLGPPTAVTSLHRLFRTDRAPWCPEVF